MSKKYCYLFTEGNANMRELLGGKGANLAEMTNIGLPVPQGFTITTEACTQYYEDGRQINDEIFAEIMEYIEKMESNFCPLCRADMRSETELHRIQRLREKAEDAEKKVIEAKRKSKKGKVYWLVKIEWHE